MLLKREEGLLPREVTQSPPTTVRVDPDRIAVDMAEAFRAVRATGVVVEEGDADVSLPRPPRGWDVSR